MHRHQSSHLPFQYECANANNHAKSKYSHQNQIEQKTDCHSSLHRKSLHQLSKKEYEYRNLDGTGNNKVNVKFGVAGQPLVRMAPARYNNDDGCSLNDLNGTRPNPRTVSNVIFNQPESIPNESCLSNIFWDWGQFIDHDITLTGTSTDSQDIASINVPNNNDPLYPVIPFVRSASVPDREHCDSEHPREQINILTPFIVQLYLVIIT